MSGRSRPRYEFGPFQLDTAEHSLLCDGRPVPLTPKVFQLLEVLVRNSGHLVEKEKLLRELWPDSFVEEGNLNRNISILRKVLGVDSSGRPYIETVPKRGYRFAPVVKVLPAEGSRSADSEPMVRDAEPTAPDRRRVGPQTKSIPGGISSWVPWLLLAGVVVFVALGITTYFWLRLGWSDGVRSEIRSIAVLPLANLSGDPAQDYFSDGLTEALIGNLAQLQGLRVVSRTSVMRFKGSSKPLPEIARDLNVDAVLEGAVQREGGRVKIMIQLIHGPSDTHLWAKEYERELADVLKLQGEVARAVANEIRIQVTPEEQLRIGSLPSVIPEAFDDYLRGRFYAGRQNKEDNETAIAALERAVTRDPSFALAYAELAQAYVWRLFLFDPLDRHWEEKAFLAVEKALSLNPNLAAAHLARGRLLWTPTNHFPHDRAIRKYRRALALDPNLDEARNQLALIYVHIGAFDEALREAQQALAINPGNRLALYRIAQTLVFQGKHEEALAVLLAIPEETNPALVGYLTAWALFNLGRKEEASIKIEQLLGEHPEDNGGLYTSIQAVLAASVGEEGRAENKIKLAVERGKGFGHFHHTVYHIACAYAIMNRPEQAIHWLEKAAQEGFPCYPLFQQDANLHNLRQNAQFARFMTELRRKWEHYKTLFEPAA